MAEEKATDANNPISGFVRELTRRSVLQIGGAYIAGAWLGAEILSFLFEQFQAPGWTYRLLAILLVVGFPISMVVAWVVQVGEDGSWEIDPSRGDYKTLSIAVSLGVLITAGLSWLILPHREPPPVYEPIPSSLAVLPFAEPNATPHERTMAETLYRSLMEGLERSVDLTLVRLGPGEQPEDLADFGESRIWKLQVTLVNPWDAETVDVQQVYAEVRKEGGRWLLERILFEQEIAQHLTPAP